MALWSAIVHGDWFTGMIPTYFNYCNYNEICDLLNVRGDQSTVRNCSRGWLSGRQLFTGMTLCLSIAHGDGPLGHNCSRGWISVPQLFTGMTLWSAIVHGDESLVHNCSRGWISGPQLFTGMNLWSTSINEYNVTIAMACLERANGRYMSSQPCG